VGIRECGKAYGVGTSLKPLTTEAQLERWFESSHQNPAPSSPTAAAMRELLKFHPDLSFDELRQLARNQIKELLR
jgi:hypothetical protein